MISEDADKINYKTSQLSANKQKSGSQNLEQASSDKRL